MFEVVREYTKGEEIASSVVHGIGWVLSIAMLVLLVVFSAIFGDAWHIVSCSIYGATIVLMYASSTMYHSLTNKKAKYVFKVLDHSSIYFLIAGTYTPITLTVLRGVWGWVLFGFVWSLVAFGTVFKAVMVERFKVLSVIIYGVMGWSIVLFLPVVLEKVPFGALGLILAGGICYTAGIPFYAMHTREYMHSIWHVFVLGGTVFQFIGILLFVIPVL